MYRVSRQLRRLDVHWVLLPPFPDLDIPPTIDHHQTKATTSTMTNPNSPPRQTLNHFRVANLATNILAGPSHDDDEEWKAHKNPFPPSVLHSAEKYLIEFYDAAKLTISRSPATQKLRASQVTPDGGANSSLPEAGGYHAAAGDAGDDEFDDEADPGNVSAAQEQPRTVVVAVITLASYWLLGLMVLIGMAAMAAIHIAVEAWR